MLNRIMLALLLLGMTGVTTACAPALGAAGILMVDEAMEQEKGGDGLF